MGTEETFIAIDAGLTRLRWVVGEDGRLHQVGFGTVDLEEPLAFPAALYPLAYPTHGEEPLRDPALRITHADGAVGTRLRFEAHTEEAVTGGILHRVVMVDRVAPLTVTLMVRTWPEYDLLEQWVRVENGADGPITVHELAATAMSFAGPQAHIRHWGGGWAGEWSETTEPLTPGTKTVASAGGVRPSLYRPPVILFSPNGRPEEHVGEVGLCTVLWGGDVRFDAEVSLHDHTRLIAGHQHRGAERRLGPGENLDSTRALWIWSVDGVGATSRSIHRFVRDQVVRDGGGTRATVVNTWEAVGFALDPIGLATQIDGARQVGGELFLLDDGWFGTSHPRDDDTTGLGDWEVDARKLPDGLAPLVSLAVDQGLRFGLWVEPEMVNRSSSLYEQHPDWVIAVPGRARREERDQLVLDLCRPDVRAFVIDVIDVILTEHPQISYLKWDANRDITEHGSSALEPDHQAHLAMDRVRATDEVMAEVARRHPEVELMLCASGGGRSDLATLAHFHEVWTSDNTDPVDRVRIQWGASHLLPANTLAAHVTRWGQRPLDFGCAVAMSGRFGFDLDLGSLDDDEKALGRRASGTYTEIRDLVQQGDLCRLVSPVDSTRSAIGYRDESGDRSVVFAYRLPDDPEPAPGDPGVAISWLDPAGRYEARDVTPRLDRAVEPPPVEVFGGNLPWPVGAPPVASVIVITRID